MFHQLSKVRKKISNDDELFGQELNLCRDNSPKSSEGKSRMGFEADDYGKLGGMESTSTLFEKVVPFRVTKSNAEDRQMDLTARFIMGLSKVHRSTKVLQVQITNELDPFFFYSLEVNEDDFQNLKVEQCILVDFATFPYKFIELLEQCIVSSCTDNPRFLAVLHLRTGDSTLTVVETNQFKHLSHLSLVFRQGNDTVIKQFLAGRLAEYKAMNGDMHEKLRRTLHSLEKALRDVNCLSSELSELKESQCRNISELKSEFTLELAHEKEKVMQETTELKFRLEKERTELETRLRQQIDQQQQRASDLDNQVRSLLDTKYKTDNKITELKNKCTSLERDLEEKTQEGERLRKEKRNLETEKNEVDKESNRHLIRLSALEQEVSDKNESLSKLTMQLEVQTTQRSALEVSRKEVQAAADRAEERASANATELSKCYQIIEKLQVELRASKQKVKLKGQVTSQQDNLLNERQSAIDKAQADNANLRNELTALKADMEDKKKKSEELTTKLDEAQNLLQSNQQMIQWLNQQLTEAQLGKLTVGSVSSRFNAFTRPNTSSLAYPCLTSANRPGEATTPLSSNSSLGANSGSNAFKNQFPKSSPYLSSTATPISSIPTLQLKSQSNGLQSGLGVFNTNPSLTGSQRSMYVPVSKIAVQAAQKVQYTKNMGVTGTMAVASSTNLSSYTGCQTPMDGILLNTWEDPGSWGSKHNPLPRPQLSFADRSGYSNLTKSCVTIGKSNSNVTASDGCQIHCSHPPSPNQQSPSGQQSPPMVPAGDPAELSRVREPAVGGASGRVQNGSGESVSRIPVNETEDRRPLSPNPNPRAQVSPPQHSNSKVNGDRKNPSPARTKVMKSPPNRSPAKSHFSRR